MKCTLCGGEIKKGDSDLCHKCKDKLHAEASQMQENAYLARWLSTRLDEFGNVVDGLTVGVPRQVKRLKRVAKKRKVDWRHPPEPMTFDGYMKTVATRYGLNLGRGRPKKAS